MKHSIFTNVSTAVVTPFDKDGKIDYNSFDRIIDFGLNSGIQSFVFSGTTGESPVLSFQEKLDIFKYGVEKLKNKAWVIAGTGSNNTEQTLKLSLQAKELGVDGLLLVTPYYNKPTQEGMYQHYKYISDKVNHPICLYNVPGRTAVHLQPETVARLCDDPNIVAIKEACGDMDIIKEILKLCKDNIKVVSGDDGSFLNSLNTGSHGVISVASNIIPQEFVNLMDSFTAGNIEQAQNIDQKYRDLYKVLSIETNPIPIKVMVSMMGLCEEIFRLPLWVPSKQNHETIAQEFKRYQLNKAEKK